MRYLKVFFLVFLFFLVMMLFVQNQASFSDMVTLKFDPMFAPAMTSAPLPRYALLLISFAIGAAVVLAMLMWDRITLSGRLTAARRRASSLQKQLDKVTAEKEKLIAEKAQLEAALKEAEAEGEAE
ncbi:LapA family protein [Mailhella massiliensis]|uniref:LapA family protein n=1 Tax=Mailhella massiliensis TaxID=1903261 RepID=UPI00097E0806|nr:LapA family protein [Mailhella massiliensis]